MALRLTQPLTEWVPGISWGVRRTVRRADNLTTFMCRLSWNLGASTSWNPMGLSRPVMGFFVMNQETHASEISRISGCWHSHCFFSGTTESSFLTRMPVESDQHYGPHKVMVKVKVNCTLVQALRLCTGRTAHRGSRGIALPFHDHGTRREWGVSVTPPAALYPRERPGTHCTGGWVGPRAGLDRCGKFHPHQDLIPGPSSP